MSHAVLLWPWIPSCPRRRTFSDWIVVLAQGFVWWAGGVGAMGSEARAPRIERDRLRFEPIAWVMRSRTSGRRGSGRVSSTDLGLRRALALLQGYACVAGPRSQSTGVAMGARFPSTHPTRQSLCRLSSVGRIRPSEGHRTRMIAESRKLKPKLHMDGLVEGVQRG